MRRCRVEAKNVTKNQLLKLVNSKKRNVLFAGISLNLNITKKESEICMFQGWIFKKQGALNIQMLRLGCCLPLSKFLATRLPVGFIQLSFHPWLKTLITPLACRLHKFSVSNACGFFNSVQLYKKQDKESVFVKCPFCISPVTTLV